MMICLPHLSSSSMMNRLVRDYACDAVGVKEIDYVVNVPLRVSSQLVECGAIQQGTGNAVVNVFPDEHVTGGCDLAFEFRHLAFDGPFFLLSVRAHARVQCCSLHTLH
jgi:hypothetical protein